MNFEAFGFFTLCLAFLFIKPVKNSSDADREWLSRMIESMEAKSVGSHQYPAGQQYRVDSNLSPSGATLDRILQSQESLQNTNGPGKKRFGLLLCCNHPPTKIPAIGTKRDEDFSSLNKLDVDILRGILLPRMLKQPSPRSSSYARFIDNLQSDYDSPSLFGMDKRKRQEAAEQPYYLDASTAEGKRQFQLVMSRNGGDDITMGQPAYGR
ncbi:uncharacterized protein LOC101845286 isoform X2 [Aplysia californica]|uniref:Uncharacterized protein LOC101845286 isoform X2 n=1 Tax=Aplysia californica TaxID=6500 RepID=A0ABM0ZZU7_APLCA|nr:uncharacterized protein LOC101845286 isoform X2 [Aplysia californica]